MTPTRKQQQEQDREMQRWVDELVNVSKDVRYRVITDAHDIGGLTYTEIADVLGDIKAQRVGQIVKAVRDGIYDE